MWKPTRRDTIAGSADDGAADDKPAGPGNVTGGFGHAPSEGPFTPGPRTSPGPSATGSRLGKTVKFKGEIHAEEDLTIEGTVEGKIQISGHTLVLAESCRAQAEIDALHLIVHGHLKGKVNVGDRVVLKETGKFEGELVTSRLAIEDGAVFVGQSRVHTARTNSKPSHKGRPSARSGKPSLAAPKAPPAAPAKVGAKPAP